MKENFDIEKSRKSVARTNSSYKSIDTFKLESIWIEKNGILRKVADFKGKKIKEVQVLINNQGNKIKVIK